MKIDISKPVLNLKNEAIKVGEEKFTVGQAVANILLEAKEGGKMKMFILAQKFFESKGKLELDPADLALVKGAINNSTTYGTLVIGQLLVLFESEQ